jgi:hypothetical protein
MRLHFYRLFGLATVSAGLLFGSGCGVQNEHACCDHDRACRHDVGDHSEVGPNGGRLIVLGDEDYHAEFAIDHANGEVIVRILDRTGCEPVGIEQRSITLNFKSQGRPHQIQLVATGCPEGEPNKSYCFCGTSDLLRGECELTGRLNLVIGGKPYTGQVAHRESDHQLIR